MEVSDGKMGSRVGRWLTLAFTELKNFVIFRVYDVDGFLEAGNRMFVNVCECLSPSLLSKLKCEWAIPS